MLTFAADYASVGRYLPAKLPSLSGPKRVELAPAPRLFQLGAPSCAPTAVVHARAMLDLAAPPLSRSFVVWNACRARRTSPADGIDLKACLDAGRDLGFCSEDLWPYDPGGLEERPSLRAYEDAYDRRLLTYYAVRTRGSGRAYEALAALDAGSPVIIGTLLGPEWVRYKGGVLDPPERIVGSHAFVLVGYEINAAGALAFRVQNFEPSWGDGPDGRGWISERYLTEELLTTELYVPVAPAS